MQEIQRGEMSETAKQKRRSFHVWRSHTDALKWMDRAEIPISIQNARKVIGACYMAYHCGRIHERLDSSEKEREAK